MKFYDVTKTKKIKILENFLKYFEIFDFFTD